MAYLRGYEISVVSEKQSMYMLLTERNTRTGMRIRVTLNGLGPITYKLLSNIYIYYIIFFYFLLLFRLK